MKQVNVINRCRLNTLISGTEHVFGKGNDLFVGKVQFMLNNVDNFVQNILLLFQTENTIVYIPLMLLY